MGVELRPRAFLRHWTKLSCGLLRIEPAPPSLPHIQAQDLEADGFELFPSRDQWALSTVTTHIAQNLVLI